MTAITGLALPVILTLSAYFVFSAAAGAMQPPTEAQKGAFYGWFYRFIQRLAANADRLAEARFGELAEPVSPPPAAQSNPLGVGGTTYVFHAPSEPNQK